MPRRPPPANAPNRVRIIGGAWRRRLIAFPAVPGLRPSADRVRETLFNWLGQTLDGRRCLDLFAGSGALGFEAASRGAKSVTMVERDPRAYAALRANAERLGATTLDLVRADAPAWLRANRDVYDVVFLDPPFDSGLLAPLLAMMPDHVVEGGQVYVESGSPIAAPAGFELVRHGRAGQVHFGLLERHHHA